jgi:hypothetical protein
MARRAGASLCYLGSSIEGRRRTSPPEGEHEHGDGTNSDHFLRAELEEEVGPWAAGATALEAGAEGKGGGWSRGLSGILLVHWIGNGS